MLPLVSIPITLSLVLEHRTKDPILEPLYFLDRGRTIIDYKFKYDYSINTNILGGCNIIVIETSPIRERLAIIYHYSNQYRVLYQLLQQSRAFL